MVEPIPRRWFPQKILPLTYDDSLSYYEFLCKILAKINELIEDTTNKEMYDNLKYNIAEEYDDNKAYVKDNYAWYNDMLYKCKGSTTGEFDESKWELYKVSDYLLYILDLIASKSNEDFWKTVELIIPNYTQCTAANTADVYYRKVDDTHIEIGVCMNGSASDKSWSNSAVWDKETASIENMSDYAGIMLTFVYGRITSNKNHAANAFKATISAINSIAMWYDEPYTNITFKKYDLCYRIPYERMSEFYDSANMDDIRLYYANKTTTNDIDFSLDNWVEISPTHSNDKPSLRDWVKAMIDEYGGGGQPVYIQRPQNIRNNIQSDVEEGV